MPIKKKLVQILMIQKHGVIYMHLILCAIVLDQIVGLLARILCDHESFGNLSMDPFFGILYI